ncbi:uncharacterized oxidoreductase YtbE-like [Ostrinia nubilalis]|uniref:uncharacterized protein LOC114366449 n=1 Tax=Ostrinia furnacalis TaxID=93504 RepID=UPI00103E7B3A|nr:uncharacterized protein LOC114366449 [Ostrinia furnacalis]
MASESPFLTRYVLNNGLEMPSIGLGTFRMRQADIIVETFDEALSAGYRMFDTATAYNNEGLIKEALETLLPKHGLERDDIFITTKLAPSDHGNERVRAAYQRSLDLLGLEYVDLYLIHFPGTANIPANDMRNFRMRDMTWRTLTEMYDEGLINSIGVSNFTQRHLDEIISSSHVTPTVNQVEWHPFYHDYDLLKFCKENDIQLQAYCSFGGSSHDNNELLNNPVVTQIAKKHNATSAQVLLVWALQHDIAVIPKTTHPDRLKENITLQFKLTPEEIKALNGLGERNMKYAWDPKAVT